LNTLGVNVEVTVREGVSVWETEGSAEPERVAGELGENPLDGSGEEEPAKLLLRMPESEYEKVGEGGEEAVIFNESVIVPVTEAELLVRVVKEAGSELVAALETVGASEAELEKEEGAVAWREGVLTALDDMKLVVGESVGLRDAEKDAEGDATPLRDSVVEVDAEEKLLVVAAEREVTLVGEAVEVAADLDARTDREEKRLPDTDIDTEEVGNREMLVEADNDAGDGEGVEGMLNVPVGRLDKEN
jgi:hypothetical protein